jgi:hypothetical protein
MSLRSHHETERRAAIKKFSWPENSKSEILFFKKRK